MKIARLVLMGSLLLTLLPLTRAAAQVSTCPGMETVWEQADTESFALIYPKNSADAELVGFFQERLDGEYRRMAGVFQAELILPVNLRLYHQEDDFYCLNTRAGRLPKGFAHTRVGNREIALVQEDLLSNPTNWRDTALNALRYELAAQFVEKVTDGRAAPGLVAGTGGYLEDPAYLIQGRPQYGWTRESSPGWQRLWADSSTETDSARLVEATTIVAYLADVYGWPDFLRFLQTIALSENSLNALINVYNRDLGEMEGGWLEYAGYYLGGRWKAHVLYSYDLSTYETLLQAGAYEDAAASLKGAVAFLEEIRNEEKAAQARELLRKAQVGQAAGALANQARQAYQEQHFERAVTLAKQAQEQLRGMGDSRRDKELDAYQSRGTQALKLRGEVEQLAARFEQDTSFSSTARLMEIGKRLQELGDQQGAAAVRAALAKVDGRIQKKLNTQYLIGMLVVLALVGLRLAWLFRRPRPEALL